MKFRLAVLCAAAMLVPVPNARATNFAILLASGVEGGTTDAAFPGGIDLVSLGLAGHLRFGLPGSFLIHKRYDKASPVLAKRCANGQHIKEAKLVLREASPDPAKPTVICMITMSDLLVSSFSSSLPEGQGQPMETFSLNFSRVYFRYFTPDGTESSASLSLDQVSLDSDGDGMSDAWERHYGLPADRDNSAEDRDGDGLTDHQEFRLGLNPLSNSSRFAAVAGGVQDDPSSIDVTWDSVPGVSYVIEWSPDLGHRFAALGGIRTAVATSTTVRIGRSGPTGFFRVRPADP